MVPFGLTNAPTIFMLLMSGVFRKYLNKFVVVFSYDVLIYSKIEEEHEKYLILLMQVIREQQLYAKLSKHYFYQDKIHYLEHIIYLEPLWNDQHLRMYQK